MQKIIFQKKVLFNLFLITAIFAILIMGESYFKGKQKDSYLSIPIADGMKMPELKESVEEMEMCVVAKVVQGNEECKEYAVSGEMLFGDTEDDHIMLEKMKDDGLLPEEVSYKQFALEVEQYVYDRSEKYQEELNVIYGLLVQDYGIVPEPGMEVIMFLTPAENFPDKYYASIAWAYYITEDGNLISTIENDKQKEYKGKKLEKYIQKIEKLNEKIE